LPNLPPCPTWQLAQLGGLPSLAASRLGRLANLAACQAQKAPSQRLTVRGNGCTFVGRTESNGAAM